MLTSERKELIIDYLDKKYDRQKTNKALGYLIKEYWSMITNPSKTNDEIIEWLDKVFFE